MECSRDGDIHPVWGSVSFLLFLNVYKVFTQGGIFTIQTNNKKSSF